MIEIIIYCLISNFIFFSYGHILKYEKFDNNIENINDRSILGCIFLSFVALILNFIFPLSKEINTVILLVGAILFIIKKKNNFQKKELFYIILSTVITTSIILYSNVNRPDAGLYHLPYISLLNENKIIFGLTNIHFRFGATSILQYLSAINNNYIFNDNGIVIPLASIVAFFIIYFFNKVLKIIKDVNKTSYSNIFSLFIVIFITYKINRYSSFGNDAVAHLTLFYLLSKILSKRNPNLTLISLISVFAFLNKTTLIFCLLIPIYFFIKELSVNKYKIIFSFSSFFLFFWIIKNIFISGCLVYPVVETCFKKLSWTDFQEVTVESISGEAWSKDWPNRLDKNISMQVYNDNFNWFKIWSKNHGKIMFNIILPFFILCLVIAFSIKKKQNSKSYLTLNKNDNLNISILFVLIGTILFFMKFPLYRYGYSYPISLFVLLINFFLIKLDKSKLVKTSKIILIICIVIFFGKQFQRYFKNIGSDFLWPRIYSFETNKKINSSEIILDKNFVIYKNDNVCMYSKSPCTNYNLKKILIDKKFDYYFVNIR